MPIRTSLHLYPNPISNPSQIPISFQPALELSPSLSSLPYSLYRLLIPLRFPLPPIPSPSLPNLHHPTPTYPNPLTSSTLPLITPDRAATQDYRSSLIYRIWRRYEVCVYLRESRGSTVTPSPFSKNRCRGSYGMKGREGDRERSID